MVADMSVGVYGVIELQDELEQCKAVINKKWSEYLKKKELSE